MYKADYLNFIDINVGKKHDVKNGSYSIWICDPEENYGYKIYFKKWGGPCNFMVSKKLRTRTKLQSKYGYKLLEMENLEKYFKFCNKLFNLGLIPEPLEIFIYKSVYGIKTTKIPPVTSDKLWEDRYNILLPSYCKIWTDYYSEWLLGDKQRHNFGQVGNKLLMLDIDVHGMEDIRKTIQ